jgi:hypothetical protein
MATDLRLGYASAVRTSRYMDGRESLKLTERVKSELLTLRALHTAGTLSADGPSFHALCIQRMDEINQQRPADVEDHSAFLKGCMYDITDRCLHRFARPVE